MLTWFASAIGGAGVGAWLGGFSPAAMVPGGLAGMLFAWAEARAWGRPEGERTLAAGYLPFALLFLSPLLERATVPPSGICPEGLPQVVRLYARMLPLAAALVLAFGVRAYAFLCPLNWPEPRRPWRRVFALAGAATLLFGILACLACLGFHKYTDLANDNELLLRMSRGEGPVCYLPTSQGCFPSNGVYWGQHFTVFWAFVAPLYRLWQEPYLLLLLQAVLIPAAAIPLYGALRDRLGSSREALGLALAFLLYPTTQHALLHEVHGLSLAVPFTAALWWALYAGRWGYAVAAGILALSCREEIAFILAGLGLYLILAPRHRLAGLFLLAASTAWFVFLVNQVMPALGGGARDWRTYKFESLGASHPEIMTTLLARPLHAASLYLAPAKLANAALFLLPLAGLPLLGGRVSLIPLPLFLMIFLSDSVPAYSYLLFYTLPAAPFLFLGAGEALLHLERWAGGGREGRRLRDAAWLTLLAASLVATILFGPSPLGRTFWQKSYALGAYAEPYHHLGAYAQTEHARRGHRILARIPSEAVVAAQQFFLPHLARVKRMKTLPRVEGADYVLLDTRHPNRYEFNPVAGYGAFVRKLSEDPAWTLALEEDGYLVFARRGAPPLKPF